MSYLLILKSIISNWKLYLGIIIFAVITATIWHFNGIQKELEQTKLQVSSLTSQLADSAAQLQTAKANTKIIEKIVTKKEYYRLKGEDSIKYIDREIVKYDATCIIPPELINELNKAATK